MSNQITCPNCNHTFEATEALTNQIKSNLENHYAHKIKSNEKKIREEMNQKWQTMEEQRKKTLEAEKQQAILEAKREAKSKVELELKDLQEQNLANKKKLDEANQKELQLRKQARDLQEQKKNMELEIARKLDSERKQIEEKTKSELEEKNRLQLAEKDKQMEQLKKSLEEAQRRAKQGSQQIQGDVQENDLKAILEARFGTDTISDVPTGIRGADLIQAVNNNLGQKVGTILWESKRTQTWTESWVQKLKDDQAKAQADISIIATQAMPQGIHSYGYYRGTWVVKYQTSYILALTSTIRYFLEQMALVKSSQVGKGQKMEYLYNYLASPQFKNKIENIVEAFTSMQEGIDSERRAMQRIWSKREKELDRVIDSTTSMYGQLQGIMGAKLERIEKLELEGGLEGLDGKEAEAGGGGEGDGGIF